MRSAIFLITFLILALSSFGTAQSENRDDQALKSLVRKVADAQLAYDAAALDRIFTADYIEISPAGEFDPRAKVLGFYKPEAKPAGGPVISQDLSEYSIRNYGKFAVVIAKITFTASVNGQVSPPRSMRATFVCRSENGGWKIASSQYTGVRPPQTQPKPQ